MYGLVGEWGIQESVDYTAQTSVITGIAVITCTKFEGGTAA